MAFDERGFLLSSRSCCLCFRRTHYRDIIRYTTKTTQVFVCRTLYWTVQHDCATCRKALGLLASCQSSTLPAPQGKHGQWIIRNGVLTSTQKKPGCQSSSTSRQIWLKCFLQLPRRRAVRTWFSLANWSTSQSSLRTHTLCVITSGLLEKTEFGDLIQLLLH